MEQKQEEIAIAVDHISKVYKLYDKPMDRMVEASGLTKKKKYREHFALSDVSFQVKKGEFITIVGHSGCGESKKTSGTCRIGRSRKQLSKPVVRRYVTACRNCQRAGKQSDDPASG